MIEVWCAHCWEKEKKKGQETQQSDKQRNPEKTLYRLSPKSISVIIPSSPIFSRCEHDSRQSECLYHIISPAQLKSGSTLKVRVCFVTGSYQMRKLEWKSKAKSEMWFGFQGYEESLLTRLPKSIKNWVQLLIVPEYKAGKTKQCQIEVYNCRRNCIRDSSTLFIRLECKRCTSSSWQILVKISQPPEKCEQVESHNLQCRGCRFGKCYVFRLRVGDLES